MDRFYSWLRKNLLVAYCLSVVALFLACFMYSASTVAVGQWVDIIIFAIVIAVFESNFVEVSHEQVGFTMTSAVLIAAATNVGLFPTLCGIVLSSPVVFIRYRMNHPLSPYFVMFNLSNVGIATTLGMLAWNVFGGELGTYNNVFALVACLVAYFITNSGFVLLVTKLQVESGWWETAVGVFELQTLILYLIDVSLGVLMGLTFQAYHVWAVPVIALILWLISFSYGKYFHVVDDARRDELTGLLNRKEFTRQLQLFIKHGKPFSVMMLDLDRFKQINDTLGHLQGDQVLKAVGALLAAEMGSRRIVARYGGEEFCVIISEVTNGTWDVAERTRTHVAQHKFDELPDEQLGGVTFSIGIASFPDHGTTGSLLMEHADQAMYRAKTVRNSVVLYDDRVNAGSARALAD